MHAQKMSAGYLSLPSVQASISPLPQCRLWTVPGKAQGSPRSDTGCWAALSRPALCTCCNLTPPGCLAAVLPVCVCRRSSFPKRSLCDDFPKLQLLGIGGRNGTQSNLLCEDSMTPALTCVPDTSHFNLKDKNVLHYPIAKPNLKSKQTEMQNTNGCAQI